MRDYGRRLAGAIVKYEAERARAEEALGVRVEVVPNGVDVPSSLPARPHPDASSSRGDRVVIGTLARLGVDKKLEQLVDAVAHAHRRGAFEGCELRIAGGVETGDEAYVEALRERSRGLPIAWVGEQDSATFLAELDLFAMVSEPSGCPNASIEAMAAGLAVVATDVGGARDQIVHGETGLLVPRGDSAALGEAIAELGRDPARRAEMARAAHARALEKYDVERMSDDYARIVLGHAEPMERSAAKSPSAPSRFSQTSRISP
jgi:glycosyltransferase involved in cell wall biosynthesis